MQASPNTADGKNVIIGPDYSQIAKQQTNSAIIDAIIAQLFSKSTKFNAKTVFEMVRNITILIFVKTLLEGSKDSLNKFKFTNLDVCKYLWQRLCYSEKVYEFILISGKWTYESKNISINTLTPFLEQKSIFPSQPGIYYYYYQRYIVKVAISPNKITFAVPKIAASMNYIETEVIHKNEEIVFGGKTIMSKVTISQSNILKLDPVQLAYAFKTENYAQLEESIKQNFLVDSILKFPSLPICVSFDGAQGTGKTTFGSYIALSGIFDRIIIYNLVQASGIGFQESIINLERQISNSSNKDKKPDGECEMVLLILDEIDKWLESYISGRIYKLREDARTTKQSKKDESSPAVTVEVHEKLTEKEEEEKKVQIKTEFLDQLYKLIDGHILPDTRKYVIIFNTNHFDRIFENCDKRYDALKDRFQRYKFNRNGKSEIIEYLKCIGNKFRMYETDRTVPDSKKVMYGPTIHNLCQYDDAIFDAIPDNIKVSYRKLLKILRTNCFNIAKTVHALKNDAANSEYVSFGNDEDNSGRNTPTKQITENTLDNEINL